jgi:endonuclease/exonuclease/phosphatase (EEP) superfamily protein YafD
VAVAKSIAEAEQGQPVIVAGDLNDVAWSPTTRLFRKISGMLDPRVGRGMFNTFHAKYPFMRWPLDHLFHSDHFALVRMERLPTFGSDHFPILIELALVPGLEHHQEGLQADADDHREADEKTQAKGVDGDDVHTPGRG